jgi:transposase InsO family protein
VPVLIGLPPGEAKAPHGAVAHPYKVSPALEPAFHARQGELKHEKDGDAYDLPSRYSTGCFFSATAAPTTFCNGGGNADISQGLAGSCFAPTYLVRDNDGAYGQAFTRRVRAMGIRDRPISPRSPWQNPYAERLIGTLRRDCLDHVLIFGERHLPRVLTLYSRYYNETRTHLGLGKDAPLRRAVQRSGTIVTTPILSGLHHRYARI